MVKSAVSVDPNKGKEVLGQLHAIFHLSDRPQKRGRERRGTEEREKKGGGSDNKKKLVL